MGIYRKQIDFPEEYRDKLRAAADAAPHKYTSSKGHVGSVNALILTAIDFYLDNAFTHESESVPARPNQQPHPAA